jgi:acid stress-induced BolA-like protein IbaG/YrbA
MRPQEIKQLIETYIKESKAIVESNDDTHFQAVVISPEFADKNRIEKQQAVYAALGNHITDGTIHAISIKTFTPEEWQQLRDQMSQQHG